MTNLKQETRSLLDKLYNLKSEDSILVESIKKEYDSTVLKNDDLAKEQEFLNKKINRLINEEKVLVTEGESLIDALRNVSANNFNVVLEKLEINFNPSNLKNEVERGLPLAISKIQNEVKTSTVKLEDINNEIRNIEVKVDDLSIRKDEVVRDQTKLNEYLELSLNGQINATRDELTTLLAKFDLTEEEQREAAKILMFPEDGLYEYDKNPKEKVKLSKSFSDVFSQVKEPTLNEEKVLIADPIKIVKTEEEVKEVGIKDILQRHNFSTFDFTATDLDYLEKNLKIDVLDKNVKLVKQLGINKDIFIENIELLNDIELENKLSVLLEIGKVPFDIYLNPNVLVKYNFYELQKSIDVLKSNGLDPKQIPLMSF